MPYVPAKRKGNGKRRASGAPSSRISKKRNAQRGVSRSQVLAIVNKGREIKRLPLSIGLVTTAIEADRTAMQLLIPGYYIGALAQVTQPDCLNKLEQGTGNYDRMGGAVQPRRWTFDGQLDCDMMFPDPQVEPTASFSPTLGVRVVFGFRNKPTALSATSSNLMLSCGTTTQLSDTENQGPEALNTPFNWEIFQPFYDKVHIIQPPGAYDFGGEAKSLGMFGPSHKQIHVDYNFGPNAKDIVCIRDPDASTLANDHNIFGLMIIRPLSGVTGDGKYTTFYSNMNVNLTGRTMYTFSDA